jgi:hypothetical protein
MPLPIGLVGEKSVKPEHTMLDISFLASYAPTIVEADKGSTTYADKDADDLMKIWLHAEKVDNETFIVNEGTKLDNKDILRLKARGLISGGSDKIKFTTKAKNVIKTMALGESNRFLEVKKNKSYSEILASMDKRNKPGYRVPKYSSTSYLLDLSGDNNGS